MPGLSGGVSVSRKFVAADERPAVTYGPTRPHDPGEYVLSVTTEEDLLEIVFGEDAMYDLWVEVRGVPWGECDTDDRDRLVRQVLHAANEANKEQLWDALEALGVGP